MTPAAPPETEAAARPWAFWSPASDALIDAALTLGEVGPGVRFLDLGCGDGRVLVAAARRGASVRGIELDETLATVSAKALADAGVEGRIDREDFFTADLQADVIYAYLTPVTLARLVPRLMALPPGSRIVTPRYAITSWVATAEADHCYRYDLPTAPHVPDRDPGWPFRAVIAVVPAHRRCLVPLKVIADPGALLLELGPTLRRACRAAAGPDYVSSPTVVPVDFQFEPCAAGSVAVGPVIVQGHELSLAVVFSDSGHGQWYFRATDGQAYKQALEEKATEARVPRERRGVPA